MESSAYKQRSEQDIYEDFAEKLLSAIGRRSVREFAEECGLSEGALRNYLRGENYPTLDRLHAIAKAAGKPVEWFISGNQVNDSPTRYTVTPRLDADLLADILQAVEQGLNQIALTLDSGKKSKLIALLYDYYVNKGEPVTMPNVIRFIDIAK